MPAAVVRRDVHGLYVRTDFRVYRPIRTDASYPVGTAANSREDGSSAFKEEDRVVAHHPSGTPFCVVKNGTVQELWHSHGMYHLKSSTECWTPAQ